MIDLIINLRLESASAEHSPGEVNLSFIKRAVALLPSAIPATSDESLRVLREIEGIVFHAKVHCRNRVTEQWFIDHPPPAKKPEGKITSINLEELDL